MAGGIRLRQPQRQLTNKPRRRRRLESCPGPMTCFPFAKQRAGIGTRGNYNWNESERTQSVKSKIRIFPAPFPFIARLITTLTLFAVKEFPLKNVSARENLIGTCAFDKRRSQRVDMSTLQLCEIGLPIPANETSPCLFSRPSYLSWHLHSLAQALLFVPLRCLDQVRSADVLFNFRYVACLFNARQCASLLSIKISPSLSDSCS